MGQKRNQLEKLLENELVCFREILYKTQQVNHQNSPTSNSLQKLLESREAHIDSLKKLEVIRKSLESSSNFKVEKEKINYLKKEIKGIALKLVEMDAKMLDLLVMKKEEIVKGLCVHSDNKRKDGSVRPYRKQIVDITLD
jgi:hypothetical protein